MHVINNSAMISKTKARLIHSLSKKKYRDKHGMFLVEGEKMVTELLESESGHAPPVKEVLATTEWLVENRHLPGLQESQVTEASADELKSISMLVTPQPVLALVAVRNEAPDPAILSEKTVLGLDAVRDPGNLGTIIRTADWFGIRHIICTPDSVDVYNPKVIQATMGSWARVRVYYTDLNRLLREPALEGKAVLGTFLEGESIYSRTIEQHPVILFGNESRGLSSGYHELVTRRITIPSYAENAGKAESLNLATSVAVVCAELRRGSE